MRDKDGRYGYLPEMLEINTNLDKISIEAHWDVLSNVLSSVHRKVQDQEARYLRELITNVFLNRLRDKAIRLAFSIKLKHFNKYGIDDIAQLKIPECDVSNLRGEIVITFTTVMCNGSRISYKINTREWHIVHGEDYPYSDKCLDDCVADLERYMQDLVVGKIR